MTLREEDERILHLVRTIFAERIPFNHVLGLELDLLGAEQASFRFDMRDELVGNFVHGTLHGGVISATLDVTGGLAAFLGVLKKMQGRSHDEKVARFSQLGTIDLRIDYLRPGLGRSFVATGYVQRVGNRVAVTRMELDNDEGSLIAVGTGTYMVG
jgi:uncharacterized protein (TIGR00369 family)